MTTPLDESAAGPAGPLRACARFVMPMEAQIFAARLVAEGLSAHVMDANSTYADGFVSGTGAGGIRVMVPESQMAQAQRLLEAFQAGEFAIGEDFDVGK
jgi:hypothetical protein